MSTHGFHQHLRHQTNPIWQAIYEHPFIKEVGAGILPRPAFSFFIRQDYLYLKDFARVLCLAAAKADDLATLKMFTEHAATVVQVEYQLHSAFASQLDYTLEELETTLPAPTTRAYTRHLLSVAHAGTLGETVAAVLPCYWIYWEVGKRLKQNMPPDDLYAAWIQAYAHPDFGTHVNQQLTLINQLATHASAAERQRMADHFQHSCRYEYLFWDQAYKQATWPV